MDKEIFKLATGISGALVDKFYAPITAAMHEFQINTPQRQAAFLAQIGHESGGFRYTKEIWGPTLAQVRYDTRTDLGNTAEQDGDGKKYRGYGLIQITGAKNFSRALIALDLDLLNHPELLADPVNAARSAAWFWWEVKLNEMADKLTDEASFDKITRKINGGLNGKEDRRKHWAQAKKALGI